jgi:peptide/nickel transport system ATP-binding protein
MSGRAALEIDGLRVEYPLDEGEPFVAVDGVSLTIRPGEIHALVGESGAGKSTIGNAIIGLLDAPGRIAAGRIAIAGREVDIRTGRAEGIVPGRDVGAIFQDPMTSLNPLFTVESQLTETMRFHLGLDRAAARARALDLMNAVRIPEPERRLSAYPHQLSGGQRQRVVIASALSCDPALIVADEPTTALDVSVQAQILKLMRDLADERKVGILLVTHNMGVVAEIADRVTILLRGRAVETGPVGEVLGAPKHPYAQSLIGAVPRVDVRVARFPMPGEEVAKAASARESLRALAGTALPDAMPRADAPVLEVENLTVDYAAGGFLPGTKGRVFRAVDGVSFAIGEGEILGLVGESGCGKTTTANVVAGLVRPSGGEVRFRGVTIAGGTGADRWAARRAIQMIFQDPYSSLNPRLRIGLILSEPILFYRLAANAEEARRDAATLLEAVGLEADAARRFPHAFSGGQRQRISIARALGARPRLMICDEPTSALDVSVQAQILNLLKDLRDGAGLTMLFISHDLAVVRQMCDRVAVMQAGRIVEMADGETLFSNPQHAYTRELLSLVPDISAWRMRRAASPS